MPHHDGSTRRPPRQHRHPLDRIRTADTNPKHQGKSTPHERPRVVVDDLDDALPPLPVIARRG